MKITDSVLAGFQKNRVAANAGLNNSYADPVRNIDWILMSAMAIQAVIGLFTVFSATHLRSDRPAV
jgi:hypothetical protein